MKKVNYIIITLCSLLLIQILVYPSECIEYALSGIRIFFNSVFPSLFPFLVLTNLIIEFDGINIYSKYFGKLICGPFRLPKICSLPLIASFLCGYPFGAKYSAKLYKENKISRSDFIRLLNIASNPGPIFILGTLGASLIKNVTIGYVILISCMLSCFVISLFITPSKSILNNLSKSNTDTYSKNYGKKIKDSIENAVMTTLSLAGFIVIFFVISSIIKNNAVYCIVVNKISNISNYSTLSISGLLLGLLEMTNGCFILLSNKNNSDISYCIISFLITFGGTSILAQVYSFIFEFNINLKKYVGLKLLQGLISSIITSIILSVINIHTTDTFPKISSTSIVKELLFIALASFLVLPMIIVSIKKLFDIS